MWDWGREATRKSVGRNTHSRDSSRYSFSGREGGAAMRERQDGDPEVYTWSGVKEKWSYHLFSRRSGGWCNAENFPKNRANGHVGRIKKLHMHLI